MFWELLGTLIYPLNLAQDLKTTGPETLKPEKVSNDALRVQAQLDR